LPNPAAGWKPPAREIETPKVFAARPEEKKVDIEHLADENIKPIPDKDFYTKPLAREGKSTSRKKSD
jgi:hypothetical protein